ncbi:MAG: dihydroorotase, partial [Chloroflexota bacterium]
DPSRGPEQKADLLVVEGKVAWVGNGEPPDAKAISLDASGLILCPGFIDLHCHLREPGFEDKETIASGSQAAARGGFTTICAMANTNPIVDSEGSLDYVRRRAAEAGVIRVLPVASLSRGQQGQELVEMAVLAKAGAVAFSDDGQPVVNAQLLRTALEWSLALGLPVLEHCEDRAFPGVMNEGWVSARLGLRGIPAAAEESMVARDIALAELTGAHLHLMHLSTAGSVELVRRAKEKGIPVTAEVTPHHLTLTEERVMGYNTYAKVNPPLRTRRDQGALLQGLRDGVIDAIATDHAPHTETDKKVEFDHAASGISGLETALSSLLTLVERGELDMMTLISRLSLDPARILGREGGSLKPGAVADITLFDPNLEWVVEAGALASKGKNTPLLGERLKGKVVATLVAGRIAYKHPSRKWEVK